MSERRFVSPAPPATPLEREITEVLIEECAEVMEGCLAACLRVQQRGTKLLRFGPAEIQPGQPHTNAHRLGMEVGDLLEVIDMAIAEGLIPAEAIEQGRTNKRRQLAKFMQHRQAQ